MMKWLAYTQKDGGLRLNILNSKNACRLMNFPVELSTLFCKIFMPHYIFLTLPRLYVLKRTKRLNKKTPRKKENTNEKRKGLFAFPLSERVLLTCACLMTPFCEAMSCNVYMRTFAPMSLMSVNLNPGPASRNVIVLPANRPNLFCNQFLTDYLASVGGDRPRSPVAPCAPIPTGDRGRSPLQKIVGVCCVVCFLLRFTPFRIILLL